MNYRWKPAVTVAAVMERDGKFLLVEEETANGLQLNNPAGHLEAGESLIEACQREALEESAWQFSPQALVGCYLWQADSQPDLAYLRFAFCGTLGRHDPARQLDQGIVRTVWLSADEVRASASRHRSPLILQCIEDYLAGRRHPLELLHTHPSVYTGR